MSTSSRYLVIAPQGLGDSLEATPFLGALRRADPNGRIDVVVLRPAAKALFEGLPTLVDKVVYLPYWEAGKIAFARAVLSARRRPTYDVSFLMYPAARREYHALHRLFPSRRRISHDYAGARASDLQWLNSVLVPVRTVQNAKRNLDLLSAAGIAATAPPTYHVPAPWIGSSRDPRTIAIHAGSIDHDGFALKRWPEESFADLGARLANKGLNISIIAGPDEREVGARLAETIPNSTIFSGTLRELALHLSSVTALVSNDTGVAHLAAAVGTPVVGLFGPTPVECAPFGPDVVALRPSSCPACFTPRLGIQGCIKNIDFACLKRDMPVDLVEENVRRLLDTTEVTHTEGRQQQA